MTSCFAAHAKTDRLASQNLLRNVATGWHKRSCAALLGATTLVSLSGPATTPAVAQTPQKPNILFIMGDDIGRMQPGIYHQGLRVKR